MTDWHNFVKDDTLKTFAYVPAENKFKKTIDLDIMVQCQKSLDVHFTY